MKQLDLTFLDLFAGCGGLSLGLLAAGWSGRLAVEKDPMAFGTLSSNLLNQTGPLRYDWMPEIPAKAMTLQDLLKEHGSQIADLCGNITLVAGGPPCQGFSLAGRRDKSDPRNQLFKEYLKFVRIVQPTLILLENVKGITVEFQPKQGEKSGKAEKKPVPYSQKINEGLRRLGYWTFAKLVRAVDYGVPQLRPRYILIGVRKEAFSRKPKDPFKILEEVSRQFLMNKGLSLEAPVTVKDAISDLRRDTGPLVECVDSRGFMQGCYRDADSRYQRLMRVDPTGAIADSHRFARHSEEVSTRFQQILDNHPRGVQLSPAARAAMGIQKQCIVPLDGNKPSHTLTTLPDDLIHYAEPRILTVREYARLQSFPDWYRFKGKYTTGGDRRKREVPRYTQVGNAVPPLLAEQLGLTLRKLLEMQKDVKSGVVDAREVHDTQSEPMGCEATFVAQS